jgi:hypothetical protein
MPIAFAMIFSAWVYALMSGIDVGFLALQMFSSLKKSLFMRIYSDSSADVEGFRIRADRGKRPG